MMRLMLTIRFALGTGMLFVCGCWMGGNTRNQYGTPPAPAGSSPGLTPPAVTPLEPPSPVENSSQYPPQIDGPVLDGPVLDGPAFLESSDLEPPPLSGFDRKRHTQNVWQDPASNFAGTEPPPIVLDGPVADQNAKPRNIMAPVGFKELPPSPE